MLQVMLKTLLPKRGLPSNLEEVSPSQVWRTSIVLIRATQHRPFAVEFPILTQAQHPMLHFLSLAS